MTDNERLDISAGRLGVHPKQIDIWTFPHGFGNTSGPFGGPGGQTMSVFTLQAFQSTEDGSAVLWCGDYLWKVVKNFRISADWGK
jgi:hypothetical protein